MSQSGAMLLGFVMLVSAPACGDDASPSVPDAGRADVELPTDATMREDGAPGGCTMDSECTAPMACARAYCAMGRCAATGPDDDGDGHIAASCPVSPPGGFPTDDCDDTDNTRFPGNRETCDTRDDDCDPLSVGDRDGDMDGFVDYRCSNDDPVTGETYFGEDCDDSNAAIAPRVLDGPTMNCDQLDNDCDGMADEGCACVADMPCGGSPDGMHDTDPATCRRGVQRCNDGVLSPTCEGSVAPSSEVCDGERRDEDCDGTANEPDVCECSGTETRLCGAEGVDFGPQSACRRGTQACATGRWGVCMDAVYPSAERCEGTIDENCDGTVDEGCTCTMGMTRSCGGNGGMGICRAGMQTCQADGTWGAECVGETLPRVEACDGTVDDDCNGVIDNGCGCSAGEMQSCGTGMVGGASVCVRGTQTCDATTGTWNACSSAIEPTLEICDATLRDEDCDGMANEGCGIVEVDGSEDHTCARRQNGEVLCWGANLYGALGDGSPDLIRALAGPVPGLTSSSVSAGGADGSDGTCAVSGAAVSCWGVNAAVCSVGPPPSCPSRPTPVTGFSSASQVAAGRGQTCALDSGGAVSCWGSNSYGILGTDPAALASSTTPVSVSGITAALQLSQSSWHACVRRTSDILCWGRNADRQLGDGAGTAAFSWTPVAIPGLVSSVLQVAAGDDHTCALTRNLTNRVYCWGQYHGSTPVEITGLMDPVEITAGGGHTCARQSDGHVACWGYNQFGQAGNGASSATRLIVPELVRGIGGTGLLDDAVGLGAGQDHTCAALRRGALACWGRNNTGQLGNGDSGTGRFSSVPVLVTGVAW